MRHRIAVLTGICLLLLTVVVVAQSGGPYALPWATVDSGGGTASTGGSYALGGTIGQPDAGMAIGGSYTLGGGAWPGSTSGSEQHTIYLPVVLRQFP